jgi:hypothetical protein
MDNNQALDAKSAVAIPKEIPPSMAANTICFQIDLASESALDFKMFIFFLTFQR